MIHRASPLAAAVLAMACSASPPAAQNATPSPPASASAKKSAWKGTSPWAMPIETRSADTPLGQIQHDAREVDPLVSTPFAKRFVAAAAALPPVETRKLFHTKDKKRFYSTPEAAALPPAERAELAELEIDEEIYYNTKYGSPLSYARAIDILAKEKLVPEGGGKILDFGYGTIGQLRMFASLGFEAVGVDVDPMLRALYSMPGDQGPVAGFGGARAGVLRVLDGRYPADPVTARAVGSGYDLVISKNVLKKGYFRPDRPVDESRRFKLGVDDAVFLKTLHDALKPRGAVLIYNICPALTPPDKPFVPFSDGRSPFTEDEWKAAGFRVLAYNKDDAAAIRVLGHVLVWDKGEGAMDLVNDLSVLYTLVQRD